MNNNILYKYIIIHALLTVISNKYNGLKYNENLQQVVKVLENKVKKLILNKCLSN